jgi:curved DNA-binding protein
MGFTKNQVASINARGGQGKMPAEELYEILGVGRTASAEEVKKAYRALARKHHPDRNQGKKDSEERFKKISAAYAVLGNEKKRKLYDQFGVDGLRDGFDPEMWKRYGGGARRAGAGGGQPDGEQFDFGGFSGFGSLEDIFEGLFGGERKRGRGRRGGVSWEDVPRPGAQVRFVLEVELLDAVLGRELDIAMDVEGETRRLKVKVPAGIEEGQTIRLGGQGAKGRGGGQQGDLLLEVRVKGDQTYTRHGTDLERRVLVTLGRAYEGGEVEVETPWGKGKLKVPPRTQGGTRFRLKGHGIRKRGVSGDLYVRMDVRVPCGTDKETICAVEQLETLYDK